MIHEDFDDLTSTDNEKPNLNTEESFFFDLFLKLDDPTINVRYTSEGLILNNVDSFLGFYSEGEIISLLDELVSKQLINKKEKGGVVLCPNCGHHTSMLIFSCPRCRSTSIEVKESIFHEECGYVGLTDEFINGIELRCPRCKLNLNNEAVKGESGYYTISDSYFRCRDCGTRISKKDYDLICVKCNTRYDEVEASYLFSISYTLPLKHEKQKAKNQTEDKKYQKFREKTVLRYGLGGYGESTTVYNNISFLRERMTCSESD